MKKAQLKVWTIFLLFFVVIGYIIYATSALTEGDPNELCTKVEITVEDSVNAHFLTAASVEEQLRNENIYPEGTLTKDIKTTGIEQTILHDKLVKTVSCYKTNNGMPIGQSKVCITVTERTPVMYILPNNMKGYYVDNEGVVIPNNSYLNNIVCATGNIDQTYATSILADFGTFISNNEFWNNQIEQIYVSTERNGNHRVKLIPRVGNHTITLGSLTDYRKKLRRMEIFYKEGLSKVGWNKYSDINLEYNNQVVCTKK